MKKAAFTLMIITIVSKIFGFGREMVLSYFYGASYISDAYIIALTIPTVIFAFIGVGISTTYIPIYSDVIAEKNLKKGNQFTSNLINVTLIIVTLLIVFILLFTKPLVQLFASGFEGETLTLAIKFTKITVFSIYLTGVIYVLKSYLQVHNNFNIPALIGFPYNIVIISSIILSAKLSIDLLAYGLLLAIISQLLLLIPFVIKKGFKYQPVVNVKDKYIKKMFYLSVPVILGTSVNQINILVDRTLASRIAVGGISALNYANRLNGFIQGIFVVSIVTVMYPLLSRMITNDKIEAFKKYIIESISVVNVLVVPSTVGAIIFAKPVVRLLFGRGEFDQKAIQMTSYALAFYAIGMIGYGLREVLSRTFYSMQDTKTPMINAAIGMVLNIILNFILSRYLGLGGLALATSISAIVTTILLFISLRLKIGPFGMKNVTIDFIKIVLASSIMGTIAKIAFDQMQLIMRQNFALLFAVLIGSIIYFLIIYFMKIEAVEDVVHIMKKRYMNT